jgi:hypothetical protein
VYTSRFLAKAGVRHPVIAVFLRCGRGVRLR